MNTFTIILAIILYLIGSFCLTCFIGAIIKKNNPLNETINEFMGEEKDAN